MKDLNPIPWEPEAAENTDSDLVMPASAKDGGQAELKTLLTQFLAKHDALGSVWEAALWDLMRLTTGGITNKAKALEQANFTLQKAANMANKMRTEALKKQNDEITD